jgi:hypothetical protein
MPDLFEIGRRVQVVFDGCPVLRFRFRIKSVSLFHRAIDSVPVTSVSRLLCCWRWPRFERRRVRQYGL